MTQTISTIVDRHQHHGTESSVYMTQTISTIVDRDPWGNIRIVYMTQTISTIVDVFGKEFVGR